MNSEMERMIKSLQINAVPDNWKARSYPSKKPLMSYIKDL
jgi:dynein heavy chain